MRSTLSLLVVCCLLTTFGSCAGVDCPLDNTVASHWSFYQDGEAVKLEDSVYVYAVVNGKDSLVINRLYNASSMDLPLSYYNDKDTFQVELHTTDNQILKDVLIVTKDNLTHFNSPECGVWHEHLVTDLWHTRNAIDSIQTVRAKIDINGTENFRIHF